jgi:hypothetical protein
LVDGGRLGAAPNNVCYGCLDTTRILINIFINPTSPAGTPVNDFSIRYLNPVSGTCLTWVQDMTNLWNNYYHVKYVQYNPVLVRVSTVNNSYLVSSVGYHDMLSKVGNNISNVINNLESILSSVFDPKYGMISGLNCLVLGEDIDVISDTVCISLFNIIFFLRIICGIIGFGVLFFMCFSVCSGMRAYRQSMVINNMGASDGIDPHDFETYGGE